VFKGMDQQAKQIFQHRKNQTLADDVASAAVATVGTLQASWA